MAEKGVKKAIFLAFFIKVNKIFKGLEMALKVKEDENHLEV